MAAKKPTKPAPPRKKRAKTGGRKAGTPNKATVAVKQALTEAFDRLGGVNYLVKFGRRDPRSFLRLWVKLLPQEIKATVATVAVGPDLSKLTDDDLNQLDRILDRAAPADPEPGPGGAGPAIPG